MVEIFHHLTFLINQAQRGTAIHLFLFVIVGQCPMLSCKYTLKHETIMFDGEKNSPQKFLLLTINLRNFLSDCLLSYPKLVKKGGVEFILINHFWLIIISLLLIIFFSKYQYQLCTHKQQGQRLFQLFYRYRSPRLKSGVVGCAQMHSLNKSVWIHK